MADDEVKNEDPAARLAALGDLFRQRNAVYGSTYKDYGRLMVTLFPEPLTLATADDWNRLALYMHVTDKLCRYARQFGSGGHVDSLDDVSVYAQMLQEFDQEVRERKK